MASRAEPRLLARNGGNRSPGQGAGGEQASISMPPPCALDRTGVPVPRTASTRRPAPADRSARPASPTRPSTLPTRRSPNALVRSPDRDIDRPISHCATSDGSVRGGTNGFLCFPRFPVEAVPSARSRGHPVRPRPGRSARSRLAPARRRPRAVRHRTPAAGPGGGTSACPSLRDHPYLGRRRRWASVRCSRPAPRLDVPHRAVCGHGTRCRPGRWRRHAGRDSEADQRLRIEAHIQQAIQRVLDVVDVPGSDVDDGVHDGRVFRHRPAARPDTDRNGSTLGSRGSFIRPPPAAGRAGGGRVGQWRSGARLRET